MITHKHPLLSIAELQDTIDRLVTAAKETELVALERAYARVLAEDVHSPIGLPMQAVSMMDGYAINSKDGLLSEYHVAERITAGMLPQRSVQGNQCARIFTGAVLPEGADTVIPQEQVVRDKNKIYVSINEVKIGKHVRQAHETLRPGELLLNTGTVLDTSRLALCASVGIAQVLCFRPITIKFFTTGNELVEPGQPLVAGKIFNSNKVMMLSLLNEHGFSHVDHQHLPDDRLQTEQALLDASEHYDVIITTGGVSVGEEDHVGACIKNKGHLHTWRVNMKPGKPFSFGQIGDTPIIGFPGNPAAAFTSFYLFGLRILARMQGYVKEVYRPLMVSLMDAYQTQERETLLRAKLVSTDSGLRAKLIERQGVADIQSLTMADGLVHLTPNQNIEVSETVRFIPFKKIFW